MEFILIALHNNRLVIGVGKTNDKALALSGVTGNDLFYKFGYELRNDLIPYIESHYSTYAEYDENKTTGENVAQSKQTVNLIIRNLLSEGYVTVTEVPENKRTKIVRMTDTGRAYCEKVVRHITWAEDTAMSMFSPEEQKTLIDLSRTFTKNLTTLVNQETEEA